jgi:hypothetical protein
MVHLKSSFQKRKSNRFCVAHLIFESLLIFQPMEDLFGSRAARRRQRDVTGRRAEAQWKSHSDGSQSDPSSPSHGSHSSSETSALAQGTPAIAASQPRGSESPARSSRGSHASVSFVSDVSDGLIPPPKRRPVPGERFLPAFYDSISFPPPQRKRTHFFDRARLP